jgi:hypothetical protein
VTLFRCPEEDLAKNPGRSETWISFTCKKGDHALQGPVIKRVQMGARHGKNDLKKKLRDELQVHNFHLFFK